jgi:CheY-like chemotaxis protein
MPALLKLPFHKKFLRVLVVQGAHQDMEMIKHLLRPACKTLVFTGSFTQAKKILTEQEFDLVIADDPIGNGKKTSGMDLWRYCREARVSVPFVLVTQSLPQGFSAIEPPEDSGLRYLHRPFSLRDCREKLMDILGVHEAPALKAA